MEMLMKPADWRRAGSAAARFSAKGHGFIRAPVGAQFVGAGLAVPFLGRASPTPTPYPGFPDLPTSIEDYERYNPESSPARGRRV